MTVWENKKCCENTRRKVQVSADSFLEFSKLSSVVVCVTGTPTQPKKMCSTTFRKPTVRVRERNLNHSFISISRYRKMAS